ncbi:MAG: DMT family transporter [Chloroflexi bacterium]|nr:DMT family transporter [Chloroflexota bacterium]
MFALFLSILWAGNPISIKAGLEDAPPLRLGWYRFVAGGIVVLIWALIVRADLRVKREEWLPLFVLGIIFSIQLAFMNIGLNLTTAGNGGVLTITFPIWVAILAHFQIPGDHLTKRKLAGVLIAYGGIAALLAQSFQFDPERLIGDAFMLASGFLLAERQVYNAKASQNIHPAKLLLAQAIIGTLTFVVASVIWESGPYVWTARLGLSIFYQGVVIAGFGFIANLLLIQRFFPSQVAVLNLTQPIFAILAAWVILGEPLTPMLWIGAFFVMIGAALVQRWPQPRTMPSSGLRPPSPRRGEGIDGKDAAAPRVGAWEPPRPGQRATPSPPGDA